jgi:hypothetical protein
MATSLVSCSPKQYGYIDKIPRVYETVLIEDEGVSLNFFKGFDLKFEEINTDSGYLVENLGLTLSTYHLGGVRGDKSTSYISLAINHHGIDEYLRVLKERIVEWNNEQGAAENLKKLNNWDYQGLEPLHLEFDAPLFYEYYSLSHFVYMLSEDKLLSLIVSKSFDNEEIINHADKVFEDISTSIKKIEHKKKKHDGSALD